MKILICVTFHYNSERLIFLEKVLKGFIDFASSVTIIIVTNTNKIKDLNNIKKISPKNKSNYQISIKSFNVTSHPHDLILCHKKFFNDFLSTRYYSHFLHTEDDMLFSKANFEYWLKYRKILKPYKLIPSFFRFERLNQNDFYKSTDTPFKKIILI